MPLTSDSVIFDYFRLTIPFPHKDIGTFLSRKKSKVTQVEVTVDVSDFVDDIIKTLKFHTTFGTATESIVNKGFWGYDQTFEINDVKFMLKDLNSDLFDEDGNLVHSDENTTIKRNANMGVCIDITGSTCRRYENYLRYFHLTLWDVLKNLKSKFPQMKVARVDLARDITDKIPGITPLAFYRQCRSVEKLVKSRSHHYVYHASGDLEDGLHGDTMTLGRRASNFYLRIYDKAKEQYFVKGKSIDPNSFWVRWEFELKHELADEIINRYVSSDNKYSIYDIYLDLLWSKVTVVPSFKQIKRGDYRIVDSVVGVKKKRVVHHKIATWFYDFVQPLERSKVTVTKPERDKDSADLVSINGPGAMWEKSFIHSIHGGNLFKLFANWLEEGFAKRDDEELNALMNRLNNLEFNPKIIDNSMTQEEAFKIINSVNKSFGKLKPTKSSNDDLFDDLTDYDESLDDFGNSKIDPDELF